MSAAAAEQILVLPEVKQRSWATAAIVLIDVVALELALLLGCIVRYYLHSIFPIALARAQYQGLALGVLTLPLAYYWMGLYPGYGMGAVQRIRGPCLCHLQRVCRAAYLELCFSRSSMVAWRAAAHHVFCADSGTGAGSSVAQRF